MNRLAEIVAGKEELLTGIVLGFAAAAILVVVLVGIAGGFRRRGASPPPRPAQPFSVVATADRIIPQPSMLPTSDPVGMSDVSDFRGSGAGPDLDDREFTEESDFEIAAIVNGFEVYRGRYGYWWEHGGLYSTVGAARHDIVTWLSARKHDARMPQLRAVR